MKSEKNGHEPNVSIIIPCYNSGKTLLRAVSSSQNQTYSKVETIVVDDCSDDQFTISTLNSICDSKTRIISLEFNSGLSAARNAGFNASKSELVVFLDADDWLDSDAIELFIKSASNFSEKFFVYSDIVLEGERSGVLRRPYKEFSQLALNGLPYAIMIPRRFINWTPLYDEDLRLGLEDWNLNLKLLENNFLPIRLSKPVFHYFVSSKGMLSSITNRHYFSIWKGIQKKRKGSFKLDYLINAFRLEYRTSSLLKLLLPTSLIMISKFPFTEVLDYIFFRTNRLLRRLKSSKNIL